jgi:hypothetical protein
MEEIKLWALENDGTNKLNAILVESLTKMEASLYHCEQRANTVFGRNRYFPDIEGL